METEQNPLEKNISRLVKQASDSTEPGKAFKDLLIAGALQELGRSDTNNALWLGINLDNVMKVAAMIAILCGAVFEILISNLVWMNTFCAVTVFATMFTKGLSYIGGIIL